MVLFITEELLRENMFIYRETDPLNTWVDPKIYTGYEKRTHIVPPNNLCFGNNHWRNMNEPEVLKTVN